MSYITEQTRPQAAAIPGIAHATWAGEAEGLKQLSIWRQSMAPGAATPPHHHDCDEVVLCVGGRGEVHIDGQSHRFGPDGVIVLPKGVPHQIFNTSTEPLETIGILASSPVGTFLPDGSALPLPWRS